MKTKYILAVSVAITTLWTASLQATLQIGDPAPQFQGVDQNTNTVKLTDYADKKLVILYFYPKDFTGGCTKEACGYRDRMGDLAQNNVQIIGVSCDSSASHFNFAKEYNLKFPLIADTGGEIAKAYDVKMKDQNMAKRVSFLIGLDGKIMQITDSSDPEKHFVEMKKAISDSKKGKL